MGYLDIFKSTELVLYADFYVFFFLFSISFGCHTWNMKQLQTFTLLFKKYIFWAIKRIGYGPKIRVGRVIGNEHFF